MRVLGNRGPKFTLRTAGGGESNLKVKISLYLSANTYVIIRSISAPMPSPALAGAGARREFRRRTKR